MHSFQETREMPYDAELIYDIVMDIEKYPEFLPWCSSAKILSEEEDFLIAELQVTFKNMSESYVSKVFKSKKGEDFQIEVCAISGPFRHLRNIWGIKPLNNGAKVLFSIDFEFKSRILDMIIGVVFDAATKKMITAFEDRARSLSL